MTRLMTKQKVRLFELLEENYPLLSAQSKIHGNRVKSAKWNEIKDILNELGPPKTTEKWRRVWTDIRKTLRRKCALRKLHTQNQGINAKMPNELTFSESDIWVIRICGMDSLEKQTKPIKTEVIEIASDASSCGLDIIKTDNNDISSEECVLDKKFLHKQLAVPKNTSNKLNVTYPKTCTSKSVQCTKRKSTNAASAPKKAKKELSSNTEDDTAYRKRMIYLQRKQLAVVRQMHERQRCHHADQRQFNARVTNLLEEILVQLKK